MYTYNQSDHLVFKYILIQLHHSYFFFFFFLFTFIFHHVKLSNNFLIPLLPITDLRMGAPVVYISMTIIIPLVTTVEIINRTLDFLFIFFSQFQ